MIRYGKETKKDTDKVLEAAVEYFGPEGQGLEITERDDCHVNFRGGGGFVSLQVCGENGTTKIDLSAREWEHQAQEFIARV